MLFLFLISSKILPIHMLFFESVLNFMYEISNNFALATFCDIFMKPKSVHSYTFVILLHVLEPKSGSIFHLKCVNCINLFSKRKSVKCFLPSLFIHIHSRISQQRHSFTRFGAKIWRMIYFPSQMCKLHKAVSKKKIREGLFAVLETEEEYVEARSVT